MKGNLICLFYLYSVIHGKITKETLKRLTANLFSFLVMNAYRCYDFIIDIQ